MSKIVCESCGALLDAGSAACPLCGTPVAVYDGPEETSPDPDFHTSASPSDQEGGALSASRSVESGFARYCVQCGQPTLPEARFCAFCGAAIPAGLPVDAPAPATKSPRSVEGPKSRRPSEPPAAKSIATKKKASERRAETSPVKAVNRRVWTLIIGGVTVVVALFAISILTQDHSPSARPPRAEAGAAGSETTTAMALPADVEESARSLRSQAEEAESTDARLGALRSLMNLYATAGRFDLAAAVQEEVALEDSTADAWTTAGNLHFDWMEQLAPGPDKEAAARRAVQAYSRALDLDPSNNDVRTDRAVAYLNDPATAMTAIEEVNKVLASDPNHLQANFNKAVMMTMIGRAEQATEFYRKVIELADPSSPMYLEARRRLDDLTASGE